MWKSACHEDFGAAMIRLPKRQAKRVIVGKLWYDCVLGITNVLYMVGSQDLLGIKGL